MKLLQGEICISSAVQHECDVLNYVQCKTYGKFQMNVLFRRCCILLLLVWQVKRISIQSQTIKAESKQGLELLKQNLIQAQTVKIQPSHIAPYSPAHPKFFMTWLETSRTSPFKILVNPELVLCDLHHHAGNTHYYGYNNAHVG